MKDKQFDFHGRVGVPKDEQDKLVTACTMYLKEPTYPCGGIVKTMMNKTLLATWIRSDKYYCAFILLTKRRPKPIQRCKDVF